MPDAIFLNYICPSLLGSILISRIISIPFGVSWRMSATITTRLLDVIRIPLGPLKMDAFGHLWLVKGFHPLLISALKNYPYVTQWVKIAWKGLISNFKLTKKNDSSLRSLILKNETFLVDFHPQCYVYFWLEFAYNYCFFRTLPFIY